MKKRHFIIDSNLDRVETLFKEVRDFCGSIIHDETLIYDLELCLNEAVVNIIKHGYQQKPGNAIEISMEADDQYISFYICDQGIAIPSLRVKKELNYNPKEISSLPESGMGLFLIYKIMDEVSRNRIEKKNVLVMKKRLDKQQAR